MNATGELRAVVDFSQRPKLAPQRSLIQRQEAPFLSRPPQPHANVRLYIEV